MATDSSVAGYLAPAAPPPDYDSTLEDIFQALAVGITGMPGGKVRPRWQITPANSPLVTDDWAAYGMSVHKGQWDAYVSHDPLANAGAGTSTVARVERIEVNYSFFGPSCQQYASILRDGMSITQNRDVIAAQGIKFVEFMEPVTLPALLKDTWNRRVDLKGVFTRTVTRTYNINNLASSAGAIDTDGTSITFNVPHS